MAKREKKGGSHLLGPLYIPPEHSLGAHRVESQKGGKATPDPVDFGHGILRKGRGAEQRHQPHDKD